MTELYSVMRGHLTDAECMRDLGQHSQLSTVEMAGEAYGAALNAVQAGLTESASSRPVVDELLETARAFKWADRNQPTRLFSGAEPMIGEQLVETIFGERLQAVIDYLVGETGMSAESAADVLQVVATVTIATAIGGPDGEADLAAQIAGTAADRMPMVDLPSGVADHRSTESVDAADSRSGAAGAGTADSGGHGREGAAPSGRTAPGTRAAGSATTINPGPASTAPDQTPVNVDGDKRQHRILIGAAAVVVIAGLAFVIGTSSSDEPTQTLAATEPGTDEEQVADDGDDAEPADDGGDRNDADGSDDTGDESTTDHGGSVTDDEGPVDSTDDGTSEVEAVSNIVTYNVPMIDITTPNRGAEGILSFDFNTETGEVCYRVAAVNINGPYRTHIHVGSVTEKGGIVVDMGPQETGAFGCLDNPPADINAILSDLDNHYAELHDVSEEWTIRGQIAQAVELTDAGRPELSFDPDGGGAYLAIEDGIAVLSGEVPDLLTATALTALYAPAGSGIIVSNNLTVVEAAPVPSGRILLTDHRFLPGSSDVPEVAAENQQTLDAILQSHQGWKLTAVGRTDGDGSELDNLELSLRRAKSLRTYIESLGAFDGSVLVRGAGELGLQDRQLELELIPQD